MTTMSIGQRVLWTVGFVIALGLCAVGVFRLAEQAWVVGSICTALAIVFVIPVRLTADEALGVRTV